MRSIKTTVQVVSESVDNRATILSGPDRFTKFSIQSSGCLGSRWAFIASIAVIALWALSGPFLRCSDTWQLVINTGTTIITFLMVFIIQNTQNRDARASLLNRISHALCPLFGISIRKKGAKWMKQRVVRILPVLASQKARINFVVSTVEA